MAGVVLEDRKPSEKSVQAKSNDYKYNYEFYKCFKVKIAACNDASQLSELQVG